MNTHRNSSGCRCRMFHAVGAAVLLPRFWLGLTKSRMAALETLRLALGWSSSPNHIGCNVFFFF